jgi:hypothetical protein
LDSALGGGGVNADVYGGNGDYSGTLLNVPEFRALYSQILNDLLCGPINEADLHAFLDALEPVLSEALAADPNSQIDGTISEFFDARKAWFSERIAVVQSQIEDFVPCPDGPTEAPIDSFNVVIGSLSGGDLVSLTMSDDDQIAIDSVTQGARNNTLTDVVTFSPVTAVSQLDLKVEIGPANASPVFTMIAIRNVFTGTFETLSFGVTSTVADTVKVFDAIPNPGNYVETDGTITIRIGQTARLPQTPAGFSTLIDEVEVIVTP